MYIQTAYVWLSKIQNELLSNVMFISAMIAILTLTSVWVVVISVRKQLQPEVSPSVGVGIIQCKGSFIRNKSERESEFFFFDRDLWSMCVRSAPSDFFIFISDQCELFIGFAKRDLSLVFAQCKQTLEGQISWRIRRQGNVTITVRFFMYLRYVTWLDELPSDWLADWLEGIPPRILKFWRINKKPPTAIFRASTCLW